MVNLYSILKLISFVVSLYYLTSTHLTFPQMEILRTSFCKRIFLMKIYHHFFIDFSLACTKETNKKLLILNI